MRHLAYGGGLNTVSDGLVDVHGSPGAAPIQIQFAGSIS